MAATNYNFFSPFFQVQLVTPTGLVVPMAQGPLHQAATDAGYKQAGLVLSTNLAIVSELSIDISLGSYFVMKVTMRPSYEDGLALMNSDILQIGYSKIQARFGYVGTGQVLSPWYTGMVTNPDFTIGVDFTLSFQGHAQCGSTLQNQQATRQWVKTTRRVIIEDLAKGSGKEAVPLTVEWPALLGPAESKLLDEDVISFEQGQRSDLLAIGDLLSQSLCTYLLVDSPDLPKDGAQRLRVLDQKTRMTGDTTRIFRLFGPPSPTATSKPLAAGVYGGVVGEGGVFPILSVSSSSKQIFLKGVTKGYIQPKFDEAKKEETPPVVEDVDEKSQEPTTGPAKNKKSARGPAPSPVHPAPDPTKGGGGGQKYGDPNSPTQQAKNVRDLVQEGISAGITLNIESVGMPDMLPGEIVEVQGLGIKLDGTYSVQKITHSLRPSGFSTRFDCLSNGGYLEAVAREALTPTTVPTVPRRDQIVQASEP